MTGIAADSRNAALIHAPRLHAADAAGQLRPNLDFEAFIDMLFGSVLIQVFTGRAVTAPRTPTASAVNSGD